jgi:hypothetical protein
MQTMNKSSGGEERWEGAREGGETFGQIVFRRQTGKKTTKKKK